MIIKNQGSEAISAGVLRTIDVGISDRPEDQLMILNILSDTLYTDKISAVWREYGCNGADANVEAGKPDTPIEIRLPTATNPTASIRDHGGGMSEEQVAGTYCKAGASTKRNSNEVTGCLGIGSKAGYAYGPAFTVTSFHKGTKTVYNCFKDNGVPRMAVLLSEPTAEPDGVEISVPVRRPDIPEFVQRAERVFRYFRVRPIVRGGKIDFQKNDAHIKGPGWAFIGGEHSVAVMGNVGYELKSNMFPSDFPPKKKAMVDAGVELYFPMGALEISANREGLQYKDRTLKAVSHALGLVVAEIAQTFTDSVKVAKSLWEAQKIWGETFEKTGSYGMRLMRDSFDGKVMWNGISLRSGKFLLSAEDGTGKKLVDGVSIWRYTQRMYTTRGRFQKYHDPYEIEAKDSTLLVLNDTKANKIMTGRVRYWFEQNPTYDQIVVLTFTTPAAKIAYWKLRHLDGAPITLMTAMPKRPYIPGQSGGPSQHRAKHQARLLTFDEAQTGNYVWPRSLYWKPAIVDKDGSGVYVTLTAFDPDDASMGIGCGNMKTLLAAARSLGYIAMDEKLVGVKRKQGAIVSKLGPGWKTLSQVITDGIAADFAKIPTLSQELADFHYTTSYTPFLDTKAMGRIPKGCAAYQLLEEFVRMRDGKKVKSLHSFFTMCPRLFKLPKPKTDLKNEETKVWNHYPMLKYGECNFRSVSSTDKHLQNAVDYINMIELMNISAGRTSKAKP